jgi:hypothetical protein
MTLKSQRFFAGETSKSLFQRSRKTLKMNAKRCFIALTDAS